MSRRETRAFAARRRDDDDARSSHIRTVLSPVASWPPLRMQPPSMAGSFDDCRHSSSALASKTSGCAGSFQSRLISRVFTPAWPTGVPRQP
jgi:hypothetical protein